MRWEFTPYAVPLVVGAVILCGVIIAAWRRRAVPAAVYLMWVCVTLDIYALAYAMELSSTTVDGVRFWLKVEYLAIPGMTALLLLMVLAYTGYERYVTRWLLIGLLALPVCTTVLAWTNDYHDLIWQHIHLERKHGFTGTLFDRGPWYWVQTTYTYAMILPAMAVLLRALTRATGLYRLQYTIILVGVAIPVSAHLLHLARVIPNGLDITPYAFLATGFASGTGMLYFHLFDVVPVAHETIVASLRDAVLVLDAQQRVLAINPAGRTLLAVGREDVVGRPLAEALPLPFRTLAASLNGAVSAESQPPEAKPDASAAAQAAPAAPPDESWEITITRDSGAQVIDVRPQALYRRNAHLAGYLLVLRDVTARRKADEERTQLIGELDAFAHTVAHDIKNPLTVISGYTQLLGDELGADTSPEAREFLQTISMYSEKLANIVNELLLLAGVRKQEAVTFTPLEMTPIVKGALERLTAMITKYKAEIVVPDTWPFACGYAAWAEEIWANYISNAIKYGGDPPRVTLGSDIQADGRVRFWVRDNGSGLSEEQQAQLFTQFTRLHEARAEGHGLGLSIVRRIADRMHGEVGVQSAPLQGSLFYFILPAAPKVSAAATPAPAPKKASPPSAPPVQPG